MPKYRTASGVVVDVPEQKAARMDGLTPVDAPPASARRGRARKSPKSDTSASSRAKEPTGGDPRFMFQPGRTE